MGGFGVGGEFLAALAGLAGEFEVVFDVVLEVVGIGEVLAGVVDALSSEGRATQIPREMNHARIIARAAAVAKGLGLGTIHGIGKRDRPK